MKRSSYALLTCLVLGAATPGLACPVPGAAKFKPDEVLQDSYILDRQGDYKQAQEGYQKVLKFFPDSRKAHYLLANSFWRDGQMFESRLEWESVLRMDPADRWGREARTWLKDNATSNDATGALVQTVAGGAEGFADGPVKTAKFKWPTSLAVAGTGHLWVADTGNGRIRKISPDGRVMTVVGDGKGGYADGPAKSAKVQSPTALALDPVGNLYFADGHRVRFLTPTGMVGTLAGSNEGGMANGDYQAARFDAITAMTTDAWGNLYVADGAAIRMVAPNGDTRTLAGGKPGFADGTGDAAMFKAVSSLKMNSDGTLIALDAGNNRIRVITKGGVVSTLPGCDKHAYLDGPAAIAHFGTLSGLAVGEDGTLFVADAENHAIRHRAENVVTVVGGSGEGTDDGRGIMASFIEPTDLALKGRSLFVVDKKANAIRKVTL